MLLYHQIICNTSSERLAQKAGQSRNGKPALRMVRGQVENERRKMRRNALTSSGPDRYRYG